MKNFISDWLYEQHNSIAYQLSSQPLTWKQWLAVAIDHIFRIER